MRQSSHSFRIRTDGPGLYPVTRPVLDWVAGTGIGEGLLTVFCRHSSASLTIQENADTDVPLDLQDALAGLAPHGGAERYRHHAEGPDDMAAHIRAALTDVSLSIPVLGGRPVLGTWQGIWLWEHRDRAHSREIALHLIGA